MNYRYPNVDFKSGGNAEATATGFQFNDDFTKLVNRGADLGVALPDAQSDEDVTLQGQNVQAAAIGGDGGNDNVTQTISV
ncbi:MAG: hypothetical protein WA970_18130 [Gammaproteobacteria bacterium]|jgi:hypothetical protein|nr:hypothetical protein [Gammaproteobacteria bacterium]